MLPDALIFSLRPRVYINFFLLRFMLRAFIIKKRKEKFEIAVWFENSAMIFGRKNWEGCPTIFKASARNMAMITSNEK